jgi:small subunit ribosomal protein S19
MNRSAYYVDPKLLEKVEKSDENTVIKTYSRDCAIHPKFIKRIFLVHNGKKFIKVKVDEHMVGRKLGEFSLTRRLGIHGKAGTH